MSCDCALKNIYFFYRNEESQSVKLKTKQIKAIKSDMKVHVCFEIIKVSDGRNKRVASGGWR